MVPRKAEVWSFFSIYKRKIVFLRHSMSSPRRKFYLTSHSDEREKYFFAVDPWLFHRQNFPLPLLSFERENEPSAVVIIKTRKCPPRRDWKRNQRDFIFLLCCCTQFMNQQRKCDTHEFKILFLLLKKPPLYQTLHLVSVLWQSLPTIFNITVLSAWPISICRQALISPSSATNERLILICN